MNIPQTEQFPEDPDHLPPARRRRARRLLAPMDVDEKAGFIGKLAHRTSPSFDFYLFSLISGSSLSLSILVDEPALFILGAILAPFMAPYLGVSFAAIMGSMSFFLRSLAGFLIGSFLVFLTGLVAGYATEFSSTTTYTYAHLHAQLSWPNLILLAVGVIVTTGAIVRFSRTANVASVALAYALYIPISIAGFGLTSNVPDLWPDGLVVYSAYLAWGALLGVLTMILLGFRPLSLFGYTLGGVFLVVGILLALGISSAGVVIGARVGLPTPIPSATPTITATLTPTLTPIPPTPTNTLTQTPVPPTQTPTPTITPTPTATPMFAIVDAGDSGGAYVRDEPAGAIVTILANGTIIQLLPEVAEVEGTAWQKVITPEGMQGWMVQELLVTATPISSPG